MIMLSSLLAAIGFFVAIAGVVTTAVALAPYIAAIPLWVLGPSLIVIAIAAFIGSAKAYRKAIR